MLLAVPVKLENDTGAGSPGAAAPAASVFTFSVFPDTKSPRPNVRVIPSMVTALDPANIVEEPESPVLLLIHSKSID